MKIGAVPLPPARLFEPLAGPLFIAAPEIIDWARNVFINEDGILFNEVHAHLQAATLGALWTNVENSRHQRRIVGQCEIPMQGARGKWARAREEMMLRQWFGPRDGGAAGFIEPDFVLTFDANFWVCASDAQRCAITEHELAHAGQERDEFGAPKFNQDGFPVFAMRGHDVETFVFLAERYGPVEANVAELVAAASRPPLFKADMIGLACGTCEKRKAA